MVLRNARDRMSVRDGLGALCANLPIPSLVSSCHFGSCFFAFVLHIY